MSKKIAEKRTLKTHFIIKAIIKPAKILESTLQKPGTW